ncbi:hypothetical protein [Fontivita pretiosa]|uniref:hypothetical protein n=1 Tax=Fontivita pretiosa TaxID=2989684 RepID=UPI003D17A184
MHPTPPKPYVWIGVQDGEGSENAANDDTITFIVGRWGYWSSPLEVQLFAPAGTATSGQDYSGMPTSVVIPGDDQPTATTTFELTPADDELFEEEESVYAILKASGDYWLSSAFMAAATIGDDDIDLAIDSNNDGVITAADEAVEDTDRNAGKLIVVNRDDNDADGILDFADGFNAFSDTSDDQSTSGEQLAKVTLLLPAGLDPTATLTFDYDAANPASPTVSRTAIDKAGLDGVTYRTHEYRVGSGLLRLWLKPGDAARTTDDFLADEDPYTLSELGLSAGQRELTLYLEAVNGSAAGVRVRVTLNRPEGTSTSDTVGACCRWTR